MRNKQGDCLLLTGAEVQRAKVNISTVFIAVVLVLAMEGSSVASFF